MSSEWQPVATGAVDARASDRPGVNGTRHMPGYIHGQELQ
jgi:hypothetical protein